MKKTFTIIAGLAGIFLAFGASAQIQYSNEFWISTNATGKMYPAGGTLDSPLDGSTEANFDSNMGSLPPNSTIHILAGTYHTYGANVWQVKTGQKILGSGIDVTVLQLNYTNGTGNSIYDYTIGNNIAFGGYGPVTNAEVCDLTCDCDYGPGNTTPCGVDLDGEFNAVRRVKVINSEFNGGTSEAWGIVLENFFLPSSIGNVIEDCEVSHFAGQTNFLTAITFNGSATNSISGIIRNNRVLLSAPPGQAELGINENWTRDVLIQGNYVEGANCGVYSDTGTTTNAMIFNNVFKDCYFAVLYRNSYARNNITVGFNDVSMPSTTSPATGVFAFWDSTATNATFFGNTISVDGNGSTPAVALQAQGVTGLSFWYNSVDSMIASNEVNGDFTNVYNFNMDNNYDLLGNYSPVLNMPAVGGVPISDLGLSLISSTNASSVLTDLGLPSYIRAGTTNIPSGYTSWIVSFSSPTSDANYAVTLGAETSNLGIWCGAKTTNGFTIFSPGINKIIWFDYIVTQIQ